MLLISNLRFEPDEETEKQRRNRLAKREKKLAKWKKVRMRVRGARVVWYACVCLLCAWV